MRKVNIFAVTLVTVAMALSAHAADKRYPATFVKSIKIDEPSGKTAWENKDFLDCQDVVLTDEDVLYALRHMRRVSKRSYLRPQAQETGCEGSALITFKNGKTLAIGIEPTGRISTAELGEELEPTTDPGSYYDCEPCNHRKMARLKDALNRADERRLKRLEAEGQIPPDQAEPRLKALRESREPKPSKN
ncbi:hypothetical protein [Variovorax sp. Varisp62]|uniref:hypothetical protein n=1 Tax=Variovorax sp. Varisp62 TaxID=3243049 RepID=UPI0039B5ECE6